MSFSADLFATTAVRGGVSPDPATGAVLTPIYQSTTYHQEAVGVHKGFTYSRAANPTVSALESALGALEDTPPAVCFATGMAAIATLFLATLKSGDHVVVSDVVYGGTVRLFQQVLSNFQVEASFVDTSDPVAVEQAIKANTRLVFIETPANPTLKLTDIAAIAKIAHAAGIKLAVDNTFLTPVLQRPLELGADITLLSTTKYIEGHNSTVGGSIATRDEVLLERLRLIRKTLGCIQSPQESWLTLRGLKTLPLRLQQHCSSAQKIAEWLEQHPKVARVHFPGLREFPAVCPGARAASAAGRHHRLRTEGRRGRRHSADEHGQALHPGRKPWRRRDAHHASGLHDPRRCSARDSRAHRHHRWPGAALGRSGESGRHHRRFGERAGCDCADRRRSRRLQHVSQSNRAEVRKLRPAVAR